MDKNKLKYGFFDDDNREYVITNPHTPAPWINYLSNGELCTIISQAAGGMTFLNSAATHRITRYRMGRSVPIDRPGHYVYIREEDGTIWSPSFEPCQTKVDDYKCRHGLGYTVFEATYKGLKAELTYFIPLDKNVLIWDLKLINTTTEKRNVKIFSYVEFSFLDVSEEFNCYHWSRMTLEYTYSDEAVHYYYAHPLYKHNRINVYMSGSRTPDSYDCNRDVFIGNYGSENLPILAQKGELSKSQLPGGGNGAGVLQFNVEINSGESDRLQIYLGCEDEKSQVFSQISNLRKTNVDDLLKELGEFYTEFLSNLQVKLPNDNMQRFVNVWTPYNCRQTFERARFVSAVHTGLGGGMQSRDSMQDALAIAHLKPQWAKKRISTIMRFQHPNGRFIDTFDPKSTEPPSDSGRRSDNAVWSIFTTYAYLSETADYDFLFEEENYYNGEKVSIFDHLHQGLKYIIDNQGNNGLPLMFNQDWNDSFLLFREDGAESVMLAQQTVYALGLFKEMSEVLNNDKISCWCTDNIDRLKKAINSDAVWDGEWYRRIIYKNKKPIGTKDCAEAKIFLNSQSWAVISNVANEQRSKQILQKADEYLSTPYGFKLLTPPYTGIELPLQFNAPGISENAGVFNHANTWAIIASALTGDGNKTFEYYSRTLPPNVIKTVGDDKYINEPYCYSSHIISEPEPRAGMALLSWLSGTCTWMYIAGTEYILGIRATLNGLSIKPCIPNDWDGFEAVKNYRGVKYNILVKRGDKKGIYLDAEQISGNILPIIVDKNEVDIFVGI